MNNFCRKNSKEVIVSEKNTGELRDTIQRLKYRYAIKERKATDADSGQIATIVTDAVWTWKG